MKLIDDLKKLLHRIFKEKNMKSAYEVLKPYAIVGWLITKKGFTIEEVNELDGFEIVMLEDEFKRFYAEKCNE